MGSAKQSPDLAHIWEKTRAELDKLKQEASVWVKKSEGYLRDVSQKGVTTAEVMTLGVKKEHFYYQLGKRIASLPRAQWTTDAKIETLLREVKKLGRQIKRKSKR